jgi:hypothetical protein
MVENIDIRRGMKKRPAGKFLKTCQLKCNTSKTQNICNNPLSLEFFRKPGNLSIVLVWLKK